MTGASKSDCTDALEDLYRYLDGELTAERRARIAEHLEACGPCLSAFAFEQELKVVVSRCGETEVPAELRDRVAQAIAELGDRR